MARVSRRSARGAVALLLASSIYVAAGGSVDDGRSGGSGRVPRGVDPLRAAAYQGDTFACEGGAKVLDARKINDEYCDCADGTDEPGTSACLNGVFHCRNRGHQPRKIPASQVNDGVCDCCDGRDEHDGRVTCANECVKLGASKRAELTERVARARGGYGQKRALVQAGPAKRELWQKQIEQLKIEIELQKLKVEKAAMIKSNAERAEKAANKAAEALKKAEEAKKAAEAAAQKLADAENGVAADEEDAPAADAASSAVSSEAGAEAASPAAEDDREETEEERGQRIARQWIKTGGGDATGDSGDATAGDVGDAEADAQAPAAEKGEKDADDDDVDAPPFEKPTEWDDEEDGEWLPPEAPELAERDDDYGDMGEDDDAPPFDASDDGSESSDSTTVEDWELGTEDDNNPAPKWARTIVPKTFRDMIWKPTPAQNIRNLARTARAEASALRRRHDEANDKLRELENKQRDLKVNLARFLGPQDEYAHMIGECYTAKVDKYDYKVCPFGDARQDHTRLGTMAPVARENPREFKFTGGEGCWGGPARSIKVTLQCGGAAELTGVEEPSRCEYTATLLTPAACEEGDVERLETELRELEEEVRAAEHDEF